MWWIYDVAVVAIVLLFGFFCYKKGLVKTLILFLGYAISAVAARILSTIASSWIYTTLISKKVVEMLTEKIGEATISVNEGINKTVEALPGIFKNAVQYMMASGDSLQEGVSEAVETGGQSLASSIESTVIAPMATFLIQSVLFFVLFILCYFLVKRIAFIASFISFSAKLTVFSELSVTVISPALIESFSPELLRVNR